MPNENSATGGRAASTRDRSYGGGYNSSGRSIGSDRPDRNRLNLDTITPKYGWDDARLSDFSILGGGIKSIFDTIASGDTYAGRTPAGFVGKATRDNGGKDQDPYMGQVPGIDPMMLRMIQNGLYGGGSNQLKIQQAQRNPGAPIAPISQGPMAPPPPIAPPMMFAPKQLSVPGGAAYGVMTPGYTYRKGGPL